MVLDTDLIIAAPGARMSILAMGLTMRPYTLAQTDQNTVKSSCKRGGPYVANGAGHTLWNGPPLFPGIGYDVGGRKGKGTDRCLS
jgi:hypothetical protein